MLMHDMISSSTYVLKIYIVEFLKKISLNMQSNFNQMICCSSSFTTRILNYVYFYFCNSLCELFLFSDVRYDNAEETKCDIIARFKTMPYDSNFLWHFFQFGKIFGPWATGSFCITTWCWWRWQRGKKKNHFKHEVSNWWCQISFNFTNNHFPPNKICIKHCMPILK